MRLRLALASVPMIAFAFGPSLSAAQDLRDVRAETYIKAVPVERSAPSYPLGELWQKREAWVTLSFVIAPDGSVAEPMIENASGGEPFERAALQAVSRWRFAPATLDGQPVEQSMTKVRIVFRLDDTPEGATSKFRRTYREAATLITNGDLTAALPLIDELEFNARSNLYEDAWFWWLKYMYLEASKSTDTEAKIAALQLALGQEDYLEPDAFAAAAQNLYVLHARSGDLSAARNVFLRLRDSRVARETERYDETIAALSPSYAEIEVLIEGDRLLAIKGEIGRYDYWVHDLLRRAFSLADIRGRVDVVDIRCERGTKRYDSFPSDSVWQIPASWGPCGVYIKGEPGTTFTFEEIPPSALASVDEP